MKSRSPQQRGPVALAAIAVALLVWTCAQSDVTAPSSEPAVTPPPDRPLILAAAGDIACGTGTPGVDTCRQMATSDLLLTLQADQVLTLGDNQYGGATLSQFRSFFHPSWGRLKGVIHGVPGNHEYESPGASGYFDYFNGEGVARGPAGPRGLGYGSFEVGAWHLIGLNSNCGQVDCAEELRWLRTDLAINARLCTLAFWHHPLFTAAPMTGTPAVKPFWTELHTARAELVLNGHSHNYQRFAPQTPEGVLDESQGLRQFVVGTGGRSLYPFQGTAANTQARSDTAFGVLKLALYTNRYEWAFLPIAGQTFGDSGSGLCH